MIAKKSLGQNFLNDEKALEQILCAAELHDYDNVLEIGPGTGILTCGLLERTEKVLVVEKDEELADKLRNRFQMFAEGQKIFIFSEDILKINLPEILEKNNMERYKVVANIPYYITGKILRLLFETKYTPEIIVLLVQKEVAQRICAEPGKMNRLSTIVRYFGVPEMIATVPRESFAPIPKVDSAILKITPNKNGRHEREGTEEEFLKLVKIGFSSPRKKILNNLSAGLHRSKDDVCEILRKSGVDIDIRAQNVSIGEWKEILKNL